MHRRIAFRVDASVDIGTGHVMRCLALARALRDLGASCMFLCRDHPGNLVDVIAAQGYDTIILPLSSTFPASDPASARIGATWQQDASDVIAALTQWGADSLVVDHYDLDWQWEKLAYRAVRRLMVVDDLADREHDCDLLLDQTLGRQNAAYKALAPARCTLLLGSQNALLRPEFAELRSSTLRRRDDPSLRNILVSLGGVDKHNVTYSVLNILNECDLLNDVTVVVVLGRSAPGLDMVRKASLTTSFTTRLVVHTKEMAQLMAAADLSIGAAGSTSWERCCLGLPAIQLVLADNQREIADALACANAALTTTVAGLQGTLRAFLTPPNLPQRLKEMSVRAASLVDGRGVDRVSEHLMSPL